MRWSQTLIPTLKETPAEAEIVSHKLLLRAGLIRKLTGGLYTFMPLGLRALRKVEQIVREEMNRAGALELLMPALQPPDIWQQSGRYESAKDVLFKVRDRAKKEWVLGPTHEEVITTLVAGEINSYRQMPKNFYQIQTKFRDEIRPRFGLMRAKEFIMKDAYSFDATDEAAQASYRKMYDAYARIFQRCGLKTIAVEADTGVMGGKFSHEFMVPAETGENEVVFCDGVRLCGERGEGDQPQSKVQSPQSAGLADREVCHAGRGDHRGAEQGASQRGRRSPDQDAGLYGGEQDRADPAARRRPVERGQARQRARHRDRCGPPRPEEIFAALGAHPGSLGAVGVTKLPVYADERLRDAADMTTGANADGFHLRHVAIGRDIQVAHWADLRLVQAGEPCPKCGKPLKVQRAIEVGHVFKLGTKYSEALNALFLDEAGKQQPAIMGCYGIGVTRTLQAVIEQSHDANGIIWPLSVAPYTVCITPLNVAPESAGHAARRADLRRPDRPRSGCHPRRPQRPARGEVQGLGAGRLPDPRWDWREVAGQRRSGDQAPRRRADPGQGGRSG